MVVKDSCKNYIDMDVVEEDGFLWRFTGIYGEPQTENKHRTWKLMRDLHAGRIRPWLCAGDFNEILHQHEKEGGCREHKVAWTDSRRRSRIVSFMTWVSPVMFLPGGITNTE